MAKRPISLQMYTLRDQVAADYLGTLRAVAELGYGAVELTTLGTYSAADLRGELDTLGLQVSGMHIGLQRLESDLGTAIAEIKALGSNYIVCPALPQDRRTSADDYRAIAKVLNQIGRTCKDHGVTFCYHNHNFEFQQFDQRTGYDILLDETDPNLVKVQLDVYWVAYAGIDPIAMLHSLKGRVPLVHLKDMADTPQREFAEVGHGTLDIPAIMQAADEAGAEWYIVEQDRCARPPLESVGMSLAYLRSIGRA